MTAAMLQCWRRNAAAIRYGLCSKANTNLQSKHLFATHSKAYQQMKDATIVNPADKYKENSENLHRYGQYIMSCMPRFIQQFSVYKDELTIYVPPSGVLEVAYFLRDHHACQFKSIIDVCGVDYPTRENRFEVVYNLLSIRHNARIRMKTYASETTPVPSVTDVWSGANWYERETYDMYGVFFVGHPDLRRILTDYGFEGHPLRKDFPLTGYTEVRWDEEKKRVVYEPLELSQAFRNFDMGSAWETAGEGRDATPEAFQLKKPQEEEESSKK